MNIPSPKKFKKLLEMKSDYCKWESGINPKTGRAIKIGGLIHREIGVEFAEYIQYREYIDNPEIYKKRISKIVKKKSDKPFGKNRHLEGGCRGLHKTISLTNSTGGCSEYKECLKCGSKSELVLSP